MKIKAIIFDLNGCLGGSGGLFSVTKFGLILERLNKAGVKMFILSNGSGSMIKTNPAHAILVRKFFAGEYYSNNTGHFKPDPDALLEVLVDNNLSAEECLFIDDDEDNIAMAKKMGTSVIAHKENNQTIDDIIRVFDLD